VIGHWQARGSEEAGLPVYAAGFVAELTDRHARAAADLDAGYADPDDHR
jgi:hypothetical protein